MLNLGWNPGRVDVYEDREIIEMLPHLERLKEIFTQTVARPNIPYYSRVSDILQRYIHACISGKISPEKALEEIENKLAILSKRYEDL